MPLLDTTAPSVAQLEEACEWLAQQTARGPVYVHCASGHGRSATFAAAYLLASGLETTAQDAVKRLQEARPGVSLNAAQMQVLREFELLASEG